MDVEQVLPGASLAPGFLSEFSSSRLLRGFSGNIAHSGWDLPDVSVENRAVLRDEHDREAPGGIRFQRHDPDGTGRTDHIAFETRSIRGFEVGSHHRPDAALISQVVTEVTK